MGAFLVNCMRKPFQSKIKSRVLRVTSRKQKNETYEPKKQ